LKHRNRKRLFFFRREEGGVSFWEGRVHKKLYFLLILMLVLKIHDIEAAKSLSFRLEEDQYNFRLLSEEKAFRFALTGRGESPQMIEPGGSLEYGLLRAGSLRREGFFREIVSPFSVSLHSSLYRETPGYRGDFSLRPVHRYGFSLSPERGRGIALITEEDAEELWGWWGFSFKEGTRLEPFFVSSFPTFEKQEAMQSEYAVSTHSSPLLHTGFRLAFEETGAGIDLLALGEMSRLGKPGFYTRFRCFGDLPVGKIDSLQTVLLGRFSTGSYTGLDGALTERTGEIQFRTSLESEWLAASLMGGVSRERMSPVPRRYLSTGRMWAGTMRVGGDPCSLYGEIENNWDWDEAGVFQGDSHAGLSMRVKADCFDGRIGFERKVESDGSTEDLLDVKIEITLPQADMELQVDSAGKGMVRLDFEPPGRQMNAGGTGAGSDDASRCKAFFLLETEKGSAGPEMRLSLGWTCEEE
jgi:hypothetical protein